MTLSSTPRCIKLIDKFVYSHLYLIGIFSLFLTFWTYLAKSSNHAILEESFGTKCGLLVEKWILPLLPWWSFPKSRPMKIVVTYKISISMPAKLAHDVGIQNMHFLIQIMEKILLDKIMEFIMRQKFLSKFMSDKITWSYSFLSQAISGHQ